VVAVVLIVSEGMGILGILLAYIVGETSGLLLSVIVERRSLEWRIEPDLMRRTLTFGAPLAFGSLAAILLNGSDRYVLSILAGTEQVALFDLGYRVAGVISMLVIMPLNLALPAIAARKFRTPGDKRYYSKIMTYFVLVMSWVGLALCLFAPEIVMVFTKKPTYWPAANIVPLQVATFILIGMRFVAVQGLYLTQRTRIIAMLVFGAALINIAANVVLVPLLQAYGSAAAGLFSMFLLLLITKRKADKEYAIPFEIGKLIRIVLIGALFVICSRTFLPPGTIVSALGNVLILLVFPISLLAFRIYEPIEIQRIREILLAGRPGSLDPGQKN
jgi:O-antigen/teichoic acid export membrane protein